MHTPHYDPHDRSTIIPLPERPKPPAFVATSKPQSLADQQSSSLPSPSVPPSTKILSPPSSTTNLGRAASTTTPQNFQNGRRQDETSWRTIAAKKDYWRLAIEKLQDEDSSVADQIAGVQRAAADAGDADFAVQLLHTTEQSQQVLEAKRWKITTGSREFVLRDQFGRLMKAVTWLKDVGTAAGSIDPLHAGLPLAGFCVLMQVCPVTCCARDISNTDNVLDGDQRL